MLNTIVKKWKIENSKLFKGECNMCGNYDHIASDRWRNKNKNDNRNDNKSAINPHVNRECKKCVKRGHKDLDCWAKKGKEKENVFNNLFLGAKFCGKVQEENNEEDPKEWLGDSGASSHITHKKKDMIDVKKCEINITVENGHKMKCELKVSLKMKMQYGQTVKLTKVLYVPQAVKNILRVLRLVSKGATIGATQDKKDYQEKRC